MRDVRPREIMFGKKRTHIQDIVEANLDSLVRFAMFRVNNRAEAEDIVYEAVLRLLENSSKVNDARCYLFRIVYNLCQDHYRHKHPEFVTIDNIDVAQTSEDDALNQEEIDRINYLLDDLPPNEKEAVMMNVVDGLSFVEMSHILSVPQSTLKSRCYAGLRKLKQSLEKHNKNG